MLKLVDETTFKDERELTVYSIGPSNEFKNQFLSWKLLYLPSQHLKLLLSWKYFATWHGKGIVYGIGGAAKARVREQVRNKGTGSIVVQSCVDFATVTSKLLPNVKIIHTDEAEIQSKIQTKLDPWNTFCEISRGSNCHFASCTGSVINV